MRPRVNVKAGRVVLIPSEEDEHITVADWLRARRVFFIHTPNEGKRSWRTGKTLKRMGLLPGVADFLIFDHTLQVDYGVAMELKARDGKPPTQEQKDFLAEMERVGWITGWHRGADAAIRWLISLGY